MGSIIISHHLPFNHYQQEKRLQRARNNPKAVSYNDFVSVLEDEGYTIRMTKGSHRVASRTIEETTFKLVFVEPHGKKRGMNPSDVKRLLKQLDEANELIAESDEDND